MRLALLFLVLTTAVGCTHSVTKFYPEIIPKKNQVSLPVNGGRDKVSLTYLGCGNMVIERNGESILTDPFFSTQGFLKMAGEIRSKPELFETWKSRLEAQTLRGQVRAALVSHTHYDHVMDLPTLLQAHYFPKLETVYGNAYLPEMMVNFSKEGVKMQTLSNEQVYQPRANNDQSYEWVHVTPSIRFLAIETNHAPHTKHMLFMSRPLDAAYFKKHLTWPNDKTKSRKWSLGTTYAFLVDFIGPDTLRMYIQTSASQYPCGAPPAAELAKKKVDVAVLCYASTPNVTDYPSSIARQIDAKKMVIVHWEDFFRDARDEDDVKLVRSTNPKKTRKRFDQLGKKKDFFVMPKPGTRIDITY